MAERSLPAPRIPTAIDLRRSESYYEVKGTIFGALIEAIDLAQLAKLDADSAREEIRDIVAEIVAIKNVLMSVAEQDHLLHDIINDVLGYGPLEPLLARDEIADIMVNGAKRGLHRSRRQGPADRHPLPRQSAADEYLPADRQPGRPPGRRVLADLRRAPARRQPRQRHRPAAGARWADADHPEVPQGQADDEELVKYGSIIPEGAGPRRHRRLPLQHAHLGRHRLGQDHAAQHPHRFIDPDERVVTCEDAAELQLQQPHVVRLETRPPNLEGEGQVTMRDLVQNCLRMRPERIIVGEVRGPEAFDLLQAMNTGHDGSMGTLHANIAARGDQPP